MSRPSASEFSRAWRSLWDKKSPYYLPNALSKKTRVGFSWFRPVEVPVPDSGQIVVLNSSAFGIVTINLQNASVSNLSSVVSDGFEYDEKTGKLAASLRFASLLYSGDYEVRRGRATGDALKLASRSFKGLPIFAAVDPDPNLTLAKSFQPKLSQTPNGQQMLSNYYTHNAAFAQAFQNQAFAYHWANDSMYGGKNTQAWAALTSNAAQPGNTSNVVVNSSDGKTYDPNYGYHAFHMQNLVTVTCNNQNNPDAGTAASTFKLATLSPSATPQTVDSTFNVVATGTPPSSADVANFVPPPWLAAIEENNKHIHEKIRQEEEDVRRGVIIREETIRPIRSGFRSNVPAPSLKLTGTVEENAEGNPQVKFDSIDGTVQDVELALGVFPGNLHPELTAAVGKAGFLKSVLSRQVTNSLAASPLLSHVGRLLTLSLIGNQRPIR